MIQQSHSWAHIQKRQKFEFEKTHAFQCSQQHYKQKPRHGSILNVQQQVNG